MSRDFNDALRDGRLPTTDDAEPIPMLEDEDIARWSMGKRYGPKDLDKDRNRSLIGFACLPPWPNTFGEKGLDTGHGLGKELESYLGGGFAPGEMYAIGAARAKAGKTAFLMQLAEGLALRSASVALGAEGLERLKQANELDDLERSVIDAVAQVGLRTYGDVLTPVIIISEMSSSALTRRWLARWTGGSAGWFRAGKSALQTARPEKGIDEAWCHADRALRLGLMAEARNGHMLQVPSSVAQEFDGDNSWKLGKIISRWQDLLQDKHGKDVVPVLVIDPVQRFALSEDNEVAALSRFVATIREWTTGETGGGSGWITLLTSDATKDTAKGKSEREGDDAATAVFRGSYHLIHEVSAVFVLDAPNDSAINAAQRDKEGPASSKKDAIARKCSAHSDTLRAERVELQVTVAYNRNGRNTGGGLAPEPRFDWRPSRQRLYPVTKEEGERRRKVDADMVKLLKQEKADAKRKEGAHSKKQTNGVEIQEMKCLDENGMPPGVFDDGEV